MADLDSFQARIAGVIRSHRMLDAGDTVLVGVSGGADSVCLARILCELGISTALAHVNHALRGRDSDEDEEFVRSLAALLGLRLFRRSAPVGPGPGNLEATARRSRRDFLDETARDHGFSRIALAHSADDRLETFLLHLVRGSGVQGLTSMRPVAGNIIRPLIEASRAEIEAYLEGIGQPWRTDASNLDTRLARNRMRHEVIPRLRSSFNPKLADSVARTVEILTAESDWMDRAAEAWLEARTSWRGGFLIMDISDLASEPVAMVRRVLRSALKTAGSALTDVGYAHIEQIRSLLETGKSGKAIQIPGRIQIERNFDELVFQTEGSAPAGYEYELPIPGRVHIPEIGADFQARLVPRKAVKLNVDKALVDGGSLGACVKIRNWKSGDSYDPAGLGAQKLKVLFQKERIPLRNRRRWPVVVARSSIVWVTPFPVSRDFVPTGSSQRIVELEASLSPEMF